MKRRGCLVTACIIAYYDTLCQWCIHYYIIITHYYICYFRLLLHIITMIIITLFLHVFRYYLVLGIHYYVIITWLLSHYYVIITSLLPHYAIWEIHVIMDSLLHIITLACFTITSLLPIMSLFPIIYYYYRGNLQMLGNALRAGVLGVPVDPRHSGQGRAEPVGCVE